MYKVLSSYQFFKFIEMSFENKDSKIKNTALL